MIPILNTGKKKQNLFGVFLYLSRDLFQDKKLFQDLLEKGSKTFLEQGKKKL